MQPGKSSPRGTAAFASILLLGLAGALLSGCTVDKHTQGDGENVKIATPFGGMTVKTDQSTVEAGTGLPPYPGAQIAPKHSNDGKGGHDSGAADVNMSFGSFQLRVKAVSYRTSDSPDKVLAFYRQGLARYGAVIQCADHQPVGTPTRTPEGLDCADDSNNNKARFKVNEGVHGKMELKAGSRQHQHIVAIDPDSDSDAGGTKFALVALDLPGHLFFGEQDAGDGKNRKSE
jgi:hypothetical protein